MSCSSVGWEKILCSFADQTLSTPTGQYQKHIVIKIRSRLFVLVPLKLFFLLPPQTSNVILHPSHYGPGGGNLKLFFFLRNPTSQTLHQTQVPCQIYSNLYKPTSIFLLKSPTTPTTQPVSPPANKLSVLNNGSSCRRLWVQTSADTK